MESLNDKIDRFLSIGSGYGYGYGDGSDYGDGYGSGYGSSDGYGSGYGYGDGSGDGYGSGYGDGSGDGYGSGDGSGDGSGSGSGYDDGYGYGSDYGDGMKSYNGETIYMIDGVKTLIEEVKSNFAKGWIICGNLTLSRCWVARVGDSFAHGKDIHTAHREALNKHLCDMPEEERIDSFVKAHPDMDCSYPGMDLFKWHNILTGSCEMGRKAFCADKGIDPETAFFTVEEFIRLTCNSYGSSIIRQLADRLSIKL